MKSWNANLNLSLYFIKRNWAMWLFMGFLEVPNLNRRDDNQLINVSFATASWITCVQQRAPVKCWTRASPLGTALTRFMSWFIGVSNASSTNKNPQSVDTWNYEITTPRVELNTQVPHGIRCCYSPSYTIPLHSPFYFRLKKNSKNLLAIVHSWKPHNKDTFNASLVSRELLSPFPISTQQHQK